LAALAALFEIASVMSFLPLICTIAKICRSLVGQSTA
jgi:hypothetical protein